MGVLARVLLGALAIGALQTPSARADAPAAEAAAPDSFDAAFFAQYSPNSALDLLAHVPGFALEDGGGAAANVLIDGQRPARSQSLNTLLSHLPAAQVVRVEILRGARASAAVPGRSAVANIVRSASAGDGLWSAGVEFAGDRISPKGSFSWNGRQGAIEYGLGVTYDSQHRPEHGDGFTAGVNEVTASTLSGARDSHQRGLTAQASTLTGGGGRLSLNAEANETTRDEHVLTLTHDLALTPTEQEERIYGEVEHDYELGGSFEHDLGPWAGNIDGVLHRSDLHSHEDQPRNDFVAGAYGERHVDERDIQSALLRGTLSEKLTDTQRLELGVETGAENVDAQRESDYSGPGWTSDNAGDISIKQDHVEAYATHLWRAAPHWSVETRVAHEIANLNFSDEIEQSIDFEYWTGSLQVTREFGARNQIRARIYRDIGNVNVENLITALADNATPNGIPELRPDTTWHAEIKTDLRFGHRGSLGLTLSRAWKEHTLDWIVVQGVNGPFDAPGNIGDAEIDTLNINLSTPIALIPGASLSMSGGVANSSVIDPVTGQARSLPSVPDAHVWAEFRQDVSARAFSWGLTYYQSTPGYWIRRDNIGSWLGGPSLDAFLETTAIKGVKARLRASSVLDPPARVQQIYYTPDRAGAFNYIDQTNTYSGTSFSISLAGSF
ncbi:MAG: hypothetical protein ABUL55_02315 [Pseudomonadota bacterium]